MGCCTSQEVGVANAPRTSWFSRHGFATAGFGFGANATAAANQAAAAAILRAEHAGTFSVRSIGLIMAPRGGDEVEEEEVKERSDKEKVRFSKLQPASAVPAPFMTARLESSEPLSTRPVPKRPLGMCTYILARDKRRGGRAWASPAVGNTVEMSARDIRVGDDAIVVDAWMLDEQHSYYHLGAGLLGIHSLVESAHADMNHGISTLLRVDMEILAGDTQQLVGHWSLEVRFVLAQAQPGNLLIYDHFPNRADKYHRVGPPLEPAAGNVRVTALNASLLQPDKQDDDETFLSFQCGKAERLVERPAGDPAFSCAGRLGSEPVWCSGGVDVLGATVLAQVKNLNPSLAFLYVDAWERDGGAGGAELPVASGAIKLGPLIAAARHIGGTGRLSLAQVPLFKKMKPRRSKSGKLSAATGMVPWGLAELEVRFESSGAPPKATVLRQVKGHFTFTSLHAEMLPGGEELEWEAKKEASKPFLAVSLERRARLSARRDPRNPQHVCTGNVMNYCKAAVVSAADTAASATAAAAVPGAPVTAAVGHPGHVFTSEGRQQAGASMFLHPSSEDKVTLDDFALYFEAWSRLPSDEGGSRKRGGASSECKFLGVGMLDLRPLVEAASRGQGLGVRMPVRLQLYTRRGTKRTGTWVLEASFASTAYEPAPDIEEEDIDTRPPLGAVAVGALPRNVHTSATGHFVMRVRRAKLESQYTRGWQILVKACLEQKDELIDRAHTTRGPRGKGKRRGITAIVPPVQVNKSGVASWKSVPVHSVLMELPARSICVDKHTIYLEVWGSDADNPLVLAVGSLSLRHLVQRAVGPEAMAHGFGAPHKMRVPLFYNAHGVIHPDGELEIEAWYESDTRSHKGAAAELLGLVQVPGAKLSGNIQVRVARAQIKFPRDQRGPMRLEDFGRGFMCFHVDLNMDVHDRRKPELPTEEFCTRDVASGGRAWSWGNTPGRLVTIPVQKVLPDEISLYCEAWVRDADAELVKLVGVGKIRLEEFMLEEDLNRGARTYVEVPLWFDEYTSAGEVFIAITFADERSNAPVRRKNRQRRREKRRSSNTVEPELTAEQRMLRDREPDLSDSSRGTSDSDTDSEGETKRVDAPDMMLRFGPAARAAHAMKRRARKPASPPRPHRRDRSHMFDSDEDSVVPPPVRTKRDAGEVKGDPTELDTPLPTRKGKRRRSKTRNKVAADGVVDSDDDRPIKAKPTTGRTEEEEQKWKKALQERRRAKKRATAKAKERRGEGEESKAAAKA